MSILNLMRYTVTDLDYEKLRNSNKFLGSLYYILWSILMILILANVFIAILSDAYSTISNEEDEEDLIDSIKRNLAESMVKIKRKSKALTTMISWKRKSTKNIFADTDKDKDGVLSSNEIASSMQVSRAKAREIIQQFDEDKDGMLNPSEVRQLKIKLVHEEEEEETIDNPLKFNDKPLHRRTIDKLKKIEALMTQLDK